MYTSSPFVKDGLRSVETCVRTRIKLAGFIIYMFCEHMTLHNPVLFEKFQKLERSIYASPFHESTPSRSQIITGLINNIDTNASKYIHISDLHNTPKYPHPYDMCIHDIGKLMNESGFIEHPWFENSEQLERVFKTERGKIHPDKFKTKEVKKSLEINSQVSR